MDLSELMVLQDQLQMESFGGTSPTQLDPEARAEFIRWNAWALTSEMVEATDECGWKPWATNRNINVDAALGELVDALHFFSNIALAIGGAAGMSADEVGYTLSKKYLEKRGINARRQLEGYDGVSTKCPGCGRAKDTAESVVSDSSSAFQICICGERWT